MGRRYEQVSFLSDYGHKDEFVGVVRSVIHSLAPGVEIEDITHDVTPFDVRGASLALCRAVQYLPAGIVLGVVDPGVGSERRAIAVEVGENAESILVGPDNGLLAPAVAMVGGATRAVSLTNTEYHLEAPGLTFAGRDIFAPVVANLCLGVDLLDLGDEIDPATLVPGLVGLPHENDGALMAEVLWVDRYGNAELNVAPEDVVALGEVLALTIGDKVRTAKIVASYSLLTGNELGLVVDSYGMLSLAINQASAADALDLGAGTVVAIRPAE